MLERSASYLLIGAAGLVGRHVRAALGERRLVPTYHRDPEEGGIALDVTDEDSVRRTVRAARPAVVVLAAADPYVERCEREPEVTRRVNVDATRVVADEARRAGALLVVFSSDYVFDGTAGAYSEDDERHPLNEYGRQKVEMEDIAMAGRNGLVCRTSGVFGLDPKRKNFVYQVVDRLRSGATFEVASDQLITPTYAPSLARAVIALADRGQTGVFHVAGPRVLGRAEFARLVAAAYRLPGDRLRPRPTDELRLAASRPLRCGLRVEKLRGVLGDDLTDPERGLSEMAAA